MALFTSLRLPSHRSGLVLPLVPVAVLAAQVVLHWDYTLSDAATMECYARTLVGGGGLALQHDAIVSSGFGSLIWLLLLAGAALVGLPIMTSAKLLGAVLAAAALYLLPGIPRRLNGREHPRLVDLLPSLMLAIHPAVGLHAASGLETSLILLLLVVALRLYVREEYAFAGGERTTGLGSLLPLLLLLLTGPEAPAWLGALMLGRALSRTAGRRLERWTLLWYVLPLAGYAGYLLWSYVTFADPWPAAVTARLLDPADPTSVGWASLRLLYQQWGLTVPLITVALVGALRQTNYWARIALAGLGLAALAAVVATGGAAELGRRALPAALALVILAAEGIDLIAGRLGLIAGRLGRWHAWWVPAAVVVGLVAHPLALGWRAAVEPPPSPLHQQLAVAAAVERNVYSVGRTAAQVRVLTTAPGAFALLGFRVVDYSGLTDPAIRRYRRQPRELRHLIFQDRRPNVLVLPRPHRRAAEAILHFPEAGREFVAAPDQSSKVDVGYSRRLLLEQTPWGPPRLRRHVDRHLWLVGARPLPDNQLLLLWISDRNSPPRREVELGLGAWKTRLAVGPPVYPMERWRAGEIVRQVIAVPRSLSGAGALWVRVDGAGKRVACGSVDLDILRLGRPRWQRHHIKRVAAAQGWDGVERLLMLWQDPTVSDDFTLEKHVAPRIRELIRLGLSTLAAKQLAQARTGRSNLTLDGLAEDLAEQTYQRAQQHIRQSRWSLAEADLRAASLTRPSSPWIHRRLEQAQKRMPEGDYLIRALELEIAQRALVLDPAAHGRLARVMRAHLALGEPWAAILAFHGWTRTASLKPGPTDRTRYLLAKALAAVGQLELAAEMTRRLVTDLRWQQHERRCPAWSAIRPMALLVRLHKLLRQPPVDLEPWLAFSGEAWRLARGTSLVAYCARWSAGSSVEVVLYLRQQRGAPRDLPLELAIGERRQRLVLTQRGDSTPLRRVVARMLVPAATYPVRLHVGKTKVALGQVTVGPEANFGFELPRFSSWEVHGRAFGPAPVVARSPRWHVIYGHVGERYVDSYATGLDRPTGRLISPPFKIRKDHLMLLVAGGDHPTLGVDLVLDQGQKITVRGHRSLILRPVFIPVARFRGSWARIVIRDESSVHWGYLAVDEIRQLDGPAPRVAP